MPWIRNAQVTYIPNGNIYVYDFYQQNLQHNCVPSAMVMMANYGLGRNLALGLAQLWARESQDPAQRAINLANYGPSITRLGTFEAANPMPRANGGQMPAAGWNFQGGGVSTLDAFFALQHHYPTHQFYH